MCVMCDMSARCEVCTDPFTDCTRKRVTCPICQYTACSKCIKTYFLSSTSEVEFQCLSCKKPWTLDFVSDFVTPGWLHSEYKTYKRKVLVEKEKSLLPDSQHMVSNYKLCQELEEQAKKIDHEIIIRQNELREIRNAVYELRTNRYLGTTHNSGPVEKRAFIKACPVNECRGFLNNQYHCGTCDAFACPHCLEVKIKGTEGEHTCDPDKAASIQLIAKDSKPCPNCASVIFKQSGCDYMWCTQCHTSFSWKTGRIEKGLNHNPHYYEWLREHNGEVPRNPGDEVCGGMPGYNDVVKKMVAWNISKETRYQVMECHRLIRHIRLTMNAPIDRTEFANADIRLKYLLKEIDEEEFSRLIYNRYIDITRKEVFNGLYSLAADIGEELFRKFLAAKSSDFMDEFFSEFKAMRSYINYHLKRYTDLYRVKARTIDW